nr:hypothetical protein [Tanacetum cinerariifolium]
KKGEFNTDFHPMVDFIAASPLRRNLKLRDEDGIVFIPDTELFENLTLMGVKAHAHYLSPITHPFFRQYSRRARISQSFALPTVADEPASPVRDVSEGEACPTEFGFIAAQDMATVRIKKKTRSPRVLISIAKLGVEE